MNIVKNQLCYRTGDQWLSDIMVEYVENDIFDNIDNDIIILPFQGINMSMLNCNNMLTYFH